MPLFRYVALTEAGKKFSGVIDADSYLLAKEKLVSKKILLTKLRSVEKKEIVLESALLLAFTRELSQLLSAGLPLYESLLTIEEKYQKNRAHALFLDLCDRLKSGNSFSQALSQYSKTFDPIYITMVQAGEKTGSLAWVLQQLYDVISRKQKLKKQLISAVSYPLFLGTFCLTILFGLLLFIVPSMKELFEGRALHPLTALVLATSDFLKKNESLLLAALCLIGALLFFLFRSKQGKIAIQKFLLTLPLIKTICLEASLIRFCRGASLLLLGGVPLIQALELARKLMKHPHLETAIEEAEKKMIEGKSLSEHLRISSQVPTLVTRMLALAEETGQMAGMLQKISEIYDQELEKNLAHVTTFLQPILLIILGGMIGLLILSILLPLTDVNSFMST